MQRKGHKKSFLKRQKQLLETKMKECLKQQKRALSSLTAVEKNGLNDSVDLATVILDQDLNLHQVNCCAKEIRAICQAILNVESGTYEICENCEGLIPEKRLTAIPWVTKCTKCQGAEEQHV